MTYKTASEIAPVSSSNNECPFNCIGCEHCGGIHFNDHDKSVDIICNLEDNED